MDKDKRIQELEAEVEKLKEQNLYLKGTDEDERIMGLVALKNDLQAKLAKAVDLECKHPVEQERASWPDLK